MGKVQDWLGAVPSPQTQKTYKAGIKKFEEFYGQGIETLIGKSGEETGHAIEKFYVWLKEKGHGQNTCRNLINSPIQFLKWLEKEFPYCKPEIAEVKKQLEKIKFLIREEKVVFT
jgi:hypothetical protein